MTTDPQTTEPVCKFDEDCHRVVDCDPDCSVAAAELHRRMAAPAVRPELRDQIAEALMAWAERNNNPKYAAARRSETVVANAYSRADAVLAVLLGPIPADTNVATWTAVRAIQLMNEAGRQRDAAVSASVDRATVYRESAALAEGDDGYVTQQELRRMAREVERGADPSRMAVEAQQQTETEAHPAEHTWAAELHDPLADEWVPGTRYPVRERAVNALEHAKTIGPTWKDGAPTQRRLVRMTTTYTVEQPAVVAAVAGEEPAGGTREAEAQQGVARHCVEYFLQSRETGGTWEGSSSSMCDLAYAAERLAKRRNLVPGFEYRIAQRTTTVNVQPLPDCLACRHWSCNGDGPCGALLDAWQRCTCTGPDAAVSQPGKEN